MHTEKNFELFISQLKHTNQTLDFFCDFDKIYNNVSQIEVSLNMLNYLIGKTDLNSAVKVLWDRDSSVFNVLDILIAVRSNTLKEVIDDSGECVDIKSYFTTYEGVVKFINETGLFDLFINKKVKDLVDYVFGIETGLDTNARKNRSGKIMEKLVASIFKDNGIEFRTEVYSKEWASITEVLGDDEKRFDFVIEKDSITYLIEVNFYSGGGSKLNEVARSYSDLAPKINSVKGFEFVWITDGIGWNSAKNKLQEAYTIIPKVFNLTNISSFINLLK